MKKLWIKTGDLMVDYSDFEKSLKNLEKQNQFRKEWDSNTRSDEEEAFHLKEALDESVTKRFEICYDCSFKALKRHMVDAKGVNPGSGSPKPLVRAAAEAEILVSPEDWLEYIDLRNRTIHSYSGERVKEALTVVDSFIDNAIKLYEKMTGKTWK